MQGNEPDYRVREKQHEYPWWCGQSKSANLSFFFQPSVMIYSRCTKDRSCCYQTHHQPVIFHCKLTPHPQRCYQALKYQHLEVLWSASPYGEKNHSGSGGKIWIWDPSMTPMPWGPHAASHLQRWVSSPKESLQQWRIWTSTVVMLTPTRQPTLTYSDPVTILHTAMAKRNTPAKCCDMLWTFLLTSGNVLPTGSDWSTQ